MTDIASLELRVESLEVEKADRRLRQMEKSAKGGERASDGLTAGFKRLIGPLVAAVSAVEGLSKIVEVQRNFDKLNAGLITATGSTENAKVAFEALQQFAQKTPYSLDQAVEGFTKLVNLGLTPSEAAMTSYGNTAAAMGKDLNQMIEAVADAATGEFERLKEFGIKASQNGDKVSLTFRGVSKTIGNNAKEIEKYLMDLGNNEFAGAMEQRAKTLDGAISQLGDTWDQTFLLISQGGIGSYIADAVNVASKALTELNAMLASGELEGYLDAQAIKFQDWQKDATEAARIIRESLDDVFKFMGEEGPSAVDFLTSAFSNFPENVRAFIQLMTVEVAAGLDKTIVLARTFKDSAAAIFTDDTQEQVRARYESDMRGINDVRQSSIESILAERDAAMTASAAASEAARKRRQEYDEEQKRKAADTGDRLARFKATPDGKQGPTQSEQKAAEAASKKAAAEQKRQEEEFRRLQESLQSEEEAIQSSYDKRRAIIEKNTAEGSAARDALMAKLDASHQKELDQLHGIEDAYTKQQRLYKEYTKIQEDGWTDAQKAAAEYQRQMETLWQTMLAGSISQDEYERAVAKVTDAYEKQGSKATDSFFNLDEMGKQAARNLQDAFADFLFDPFSDGLDGMLTGFLKVLQRMAAEAAAAQIFQAASSKSSGLGSLLSAGMSLAGAFFGGGGSAAASSSIGASQAGYTNYDLSNFVPTRAAGGPTVGGQVYEVGEQGPEQFEQNGRRYLISGRGGNVTPMQEGSSGGGNIINTNINVVVNQGGATAETSDADAQASAGQLAARIKEGALAVIRDELRPGGTLYERSA